MPRTHLDTAERLLADLEARPISPSADRQAAGDLAPASIADAPSAAAAIEGLRTRVPPRIDRALARRNRTRQTRKLTKVAAVTLQALVAETRQSDGSPRRPLETLWRLLTIAPDTGLIVAAASAAQAFATPGQEAFGTDIVEFALHACSRTTGIDRGLYRPTDSRSQALDAAVHAMLNAEATDPVRRTELTTHAAHLWEQIGAFDRAYVMYTQLGDHAATDRVVHACAAQLLANERLASEIRQRVGGPARDGRIPTMAIVAAATRQARSSADLQLVIAATRHATGESSPVLWQRYADACRREGRHGEAADVEAELDRLIVAYAADEQFGEAATILRNTAQSPTTSPERRQQAGDLADRLACTEIDKPQSDFGR